MGDPTTIIPWSGAMVVILREDARVVRVGDSGEGEYS
jgi:hypothetical protein